MLMLARLARARPLLRPVPKTWENSDLEALLPFPCLYELSNVMTHEKT